MSQTIFETILAGLIVVGGVIVFGLAVLATGLGLVPGVVGAFVGFVSVCVVWAGTGLMKVDEV